MRRLVPQHSQAAGGQPRKPGWIVRPVDPERERLIEIVERYPDGDPLEYDAAVRKPQP